MFAGSVRPAASGEVTIKRRWTKSWCWQHLGWEFSFATALIAAPNEKTHDWLWPLSWCTQLQVEELSLTPILCCSGSLDKIITQHCDYRTVRSVLHNSVLLNLTCLAEATRFAETHTYPSTLRALFSQLNFFVSTSTWDPPLCCTNGNLLTSSAERHGLIKLNRCTHSCSS